MSKADKLDTARSHLADIHEEVAQLWLITRKCAGVDTAEVDEQFDAVTSRIMDLGFVLDQLMGSELMTAAQREKHADRTKNARSTTDDDELDPSDPQRMTVANWPKEGVTTWALQELDGARSSTEDDSA